MPRPRLVRNASQSRATACSLMGGSRAVMTETANTPWGSWKKMKAVE
jgi:hypothetical protein